MKLKLAALALLITSTAALAAGDDGGSAGSVQQPEIRSRILSFYKFEPRATIAPVPAPFLAHAEAQPDRVDIVEAPPSAPGDTKALDHLHAAIVREQSDARAALFASRLGIGVSSVRLGRYFALGAATAFYVPLAVGVSVVW